MTSIWTAVDWSPSRSGSSSSRSWRRSSWKRSGWPGVRRVRGCSPHIFWWVGWRTNGERGLRLSLDRQCAPSYLSRRRAHRNKTLEVEKKDLLFLSLFYRLEYLTGSYFPHRKSSLHVYAF